MVYLHKMSHALNGTQVLRRGRLDNSWVFFYIASLFYTTSYERTSKLSWTPN
jgi:hypothetical protein